MERESNSMQALCRSGCGFYGNPSTDGLCSLCYKEALKKKQQPPSTGLHARSELANATGAVGGGSPYGSTTNGATQYGASPAAHQVLMETATAVPTIPVIGSAPNTSSSSSSSTSSSSSGEHNKDCDGDASGGVSGESGAELDDSLDSGKEDKDSKKKKHRCAMCRKKVGLTGFECRCGGLYCAVHRYSDKHECTFDYRELGAQEIRRNNPVVVGEKIQKI